MSSQPNRLAKGGLIDRSKTVRFTFDGVPPVLSTLPGSATSYTDTSVTQGAPYCYLLGPKNGSTLLAVSDESP